MRHVFKHYEAKQIIILDGRDPLEDALPKGAEQLSKQGFRYFLREAPSWCRKSLCAACFRPFQACFKAQVMARIG